MEISANVHVCIAVNCFPMRGGMGGVNGLSLDAPTLEPKTMVLSGKMNF